MIKTSWVAFLVWFWIASSPDQVFSMDLKCSRFFQSETTGQTIPKASRVALASAAYTAQGDFLETIRGLHAKYGPILNIPNPISPKQYLMISDPHATRQIL